MSAITDQVDALFSAWDTQETPGCSLAVIKDGAIIYKRAYGMADLERGVALSTSSIFDLGSIGKQFVATLIVLLAREGRLSLDDSVHQHIPELPDYGHRISIRQLIHHTSGVRDYLTLMHLTNRSFSNLYPEEELFDLIIRQRSLNFTPGDEHLYSNGGYFLLGVIAKRITGRTLLDLLHTYIFEPIGMHATEGNDDLTRIVKDRAVGYAPSEGLGQYITDMSFLGGYGDGPMLSTVEELFLWDQNFYQNKLDDGKQDLIEQLLTPGVLNSGEQLIYAFGLEVTKHKGLTMVSHAGSWAGYCGEMIRFPEQRFSVICLSNLSSFDPTEMALQVANVYLADLLVEETPSDAQIATDLASPHIQADVMPGFYRSRKGGDIAILSLQEGTYTLGIYGSTFVMEADGPNRLKASEGQLPVSIVFRSKQHIDIYMRDEIEPYDKLDIIPVESSDLQRYVGSYISDELDITYLLRIEEDQLFIKCGYAPEQALQLVTSDLFTAGRLTLEFVRDQAQHIEGFDLFAGRVKHIRFTRQ